MQLTVNTPKKSLNRAFLKEKVSRTDIERFKQQLISLFDKTDDTYSEDTLKDFVTEFLRKTWYDPSYAITINTNRKDLSIHSGKSPNDSVAVITEVKKIGSQEMLSESKINVKAFHELVLYYLRERDAGNISIKNLVATDVYQWFIFDANEFDKKIYTPRIKKLFDVHKLDEKNNPFFYEELKKILGETSETITCTYINIQKFQGKICDDNKDNDNDLIPIYKILSPEHLLKQPFANDSNSLDKKFYDELLYLIGLEEKKDANSNKRIIDRKDPSKRSSGSLIENTISKLRSKDCLYDVPNAKRFGDEEETQQYNLALELCITWINRILFLKLLEAQLFSYHKQKKFLFLSSDLIFDYDELNNLFFQVLAELPESRELRLKDKFEHVPYLNSSLFERTKLERITIDISALDNRQVLLLFNNTVLKDNKGRKLTGELSSLEYLLRFLDSYDFTSEGKSEIQEENKTLINASVLGLIFEKINGYKDGSFFTPGFITMYMSKETLRKAVVRRFNAVKGWNLKSFEELYDKIEDRTEANKIVNSITVCDPAVGSGHFLVSTLNELIAIKAELKILQDRKGKRLKEYTVEVINDELIITDDEGEPFEYKPAHPESQRLQEALFHEKELLIEKCLFGVDINANSVKICRLRLWIELLKNSYYTDQSSYRYLETLPNIDINIKEGNSLVNRFDLDIDISDALQNTNWKISDYRNAVIKYKEAKGKREKREMEELINNIKADFRKEINVYDPIRKKLSKKRGELLKLTQTVEIFENEKKKDKKSLQQIQILTKEVNDLENQIKETENNKVYENAFEWRLEFPEVLDDNGNFIGFDVVIGNPPYIAIQDLIKSNSTVAVYYRNNYQTTNYGNFDIYIPFIELSNKITNRQGEVCFILPSKFFTTDYGSAIRDFLIKKQLLSGIVDFEHHQVFDEVSVYTCILQLSKVPNSFVSVFKTTPKEILDDTHEKFEIQYNHLVGNSWIFENEVESALTKTAYLNSTSLINVRCEISRGSSTGDDKVFILTRSNKELVNGYGEVVEIEEEILIKPIYATDFSRYLFRGENPNYLIFPYMLNEKAEYKVMDEEFMKDNYPLAFAYFQKNKERLKKRKQYSKWMGFSAARNLKLHESADILIPLLANKGLFAIYPESKHTLMASGGFSLTIMNPQIDKRYLLALMNSKLLFSILYRQSNKFRGGYITCTKQYVENLPIKMIDEEEQKPFIELVDEIIALKKADANADTSRQENKIDDLVNKLYGIEAH